VICVVLSLKRIPWELIISTHPICMAQARWITAWLSGNSDWFPASQYDEGKRKSYSIQEKHICAGKGEILPIQLIMEQWQPDWALLAI
jgi:hypothetical protein